MIGWIRKSVSRAVMRGSARGNPLARKLNAKATKQYIASLPPQSPFVPGPFEVPDLSRPVDDPRAAQLFGDYALMPLRPDPVRPADLTGARIDDVQWQLGSYGMGGYGLFGLLIAERWLIVPIFSAASWITLDGRLLDDPTSNSAQSLPSWLASDPDGDAIRARLVGSTIVHPEIQPHSLELICGNGARVAIDPDPGTRPRQAQSGHLRAFLPDDDLRAALFFSPSPVLYG